MGMLPPGMAAQPQQGGGMPGPASLPVLLALLSAHGGQPPTANGMDAGQQSMGSILPMLLQMLSGGGMPGGAPGAPAAAPGPQQGQQPQQQAAPQPPPVPPQVMQIVQMLSALGLMPHAQGR